jgi:DNA-nicking Smr family endonuclease
LDFGDILDAWDRQTAIPQGTKKKRKLEKLKQLEQKVEEAPPPPPKRKDMLTAWLDENDVYDKDAELETALSKGEHRHWLLHKKPDAYIDLHNLTQKEAWSELETFFQDCKQRNFEKVVIIHGKGNHSAGDAVLKQLVQRFIEKCPYAGESGYNNAQNGGTGSTWILLK